MILKHECVLFSSTEVEIGVDNLRLIDENALDKSKKPTFGLSS